MNHGFHQNGKAVAGKPSRAHLTASDKTVPFSPTICITLPQGAHKHTGAFVFLVLSERMIYSQNHLELASEDPWISSPPFIYRVLRVYFCTQQRVAASAYSGSILFFKCEFAMQKGLFLTPAFTITRANSCCPVHSRLTW